MLPIWVGHLCRSWYRFKVGFEWNPTTCWVPQMLRQTQFGTFRLPQVRHASEGIPTSAFFVQKASRVSWVHPPPNSGHWMQTKASERYSGPIESGRASAIAEDWSPESLAVSLTPRGRFLFHSFQPSSFSKPIAVFPECLMVF